MKTKEQILKWLDGQPWKGKFYEAVFTLRTDLNLDYDDSFVLGAFQWGKTEQGRDVWSMRDKDFREWYNSNDKPLSWEEYCKQNPIKDDDYYISESCTIKECKAGVTRIPQFDANAMSRDLCKAFLAYMKLIQLRNAWVKDCDKTTCCYKIESERVGIESKLRPYFHNGLSFPTRAMADEFIKTFKDLLEVAKPLL